MVIIFQMKITLGDRKDVTLKTKTLCACVCVCVCVFV